LTGMCPLPCFPVISCHSWIGVLVFKLNYCLMLQSAADKRVLKDRNSETWTIPLTPQQAEHPRNHSEKPARMTSATPVAQRPCSSRTAVSAVKPTAIPSPTPVSQVPQGVEHSAQRCTACGALSLERPRTSAVSQSHPVQESPRALQPLLKQPSTPGPASAALAPVSPPQESAPVLPSIAPESPRSLSASGCYSEQPVVVDTAPSSDQGQCRPFPCLDTSYGHPPDLPHPVEAHIEPSHRHSVSSAAAPAPKPLCTMHEADVLNNPERQDMVSQLERALADLERDVTQRASQISSAAAPAFTSGLDSLAALEAEISEQHRRLADIGVLLPSSRREGGSVHKESEHVSTSSTAPGVVSSEPWRTSGSVAPSDTQARQKSSDLTLSHLTASVPETDYRSTITPHSVLSQAQHHPNVASSVPGSLLQPSSYDSSAPISYVSPPARSLLSSDYSDTSLSSVVRNGWSNSHRESRPESSSADGQFSSVSIEDRLARMGLSVSPCSCTPVIKSIDISLKSEMGQQSFMHLHVQWEFWITVSMIKSKSMIWSITSVAVFLLCALVAGTNLAACARHLC
jgi:hypothetical protein